MLDHFAFSRNGVGALCHVLLSLDKTVYNRSEVRTEQAIDTVGVHPLIRGVQLFKPSVNNLWVFVDTVVTG